MTVSVRIHSFTFQTDIPTPQRARTPTPPTVWYRERKKSLLNCVKNKITFKLCKSSQIPESSTVLQHQDKQKNWKLQVPLCQKGQKSAENWKCSFLMKIKSHCTFTRRIQSLSSGAIGKIWIQISKTRSLTSIHVPQVSPCVPGSCFWSSISALDGKRRESNA